MVNLFIPRPGRPTWNAHSHHMLELLGLPPNTKLPEDGLPPRLIEGILVWVEPLLPSDERRQLRQKNFMATRPHRVMAECPLCGRVMSAGRLHQHAKVHRH